MKIGVYDRCNLVSVLMLKYKDPYLLIVLFFYRWSFGYLKISE